MALTAGTRLGVYEVTAQIGEGGMGQVYRATDTKLKRQVAIKILPAALAKDADRLARFQREAEVLASLNHPHIAAIYGFEDADGVKALVMELVEGDDLSQRIARGPIPIDEALPIAKQIAEALEAAHEQGIIHRDLKPANVKVRGDGTVKVLDFGLAKAMDPPGPAPNVSQSPTITTPAMTQAGMILGTAAYMSPEQARGSSVDRRADVWAFGVVLWEMLTGIRLFDGATVSDTLASVLKTEPDWNALPQTTPSPIRRLLRRCLEKDRKRRLDSAVAARLEIDEALAAPSFERAGVLTVDSRLSTRSSRLPWGIAGAALLAAGVLLMRWAPWRAEPSPPDASVYRFQVAPPEGASVVVESYGLSPDGKTLAYLAPSSGGIEGAGRNVIWIWPLDGTAARWLPGTEGASFPFWSPDGRTIAYFVASRLRKIDVAGGSPVTICETCLAGGGAWSEDGRIIFSTNSNGIFQVPAAGGSPVQLTKVDLEKGERGHLSPRFLPGNRFLYMIQGGTDNTGIYVASFDNANARVRLLSTQTTAMYAPGPNGKHYLLWRRGETLVAQELNLDSLALGNETYTLADPVGAQTRVSAAISTGGLLLYSAPAHASGQLAWVGRDGKPIGPARDVANLLRFRLSPDGKQVAFAAQTTSTGADLSLIGAALGEPRRMTTDANSNYPVWLGNQSLVFSAGSPPNLFRKETTGARDAVRLARSSRAPQAQDVSPDGRYLLYSENGQESRGDLWMLPLGADANAAAKPYLQEPYTETNARFSPDSQWVAYAANEDGPYAVYLQSFPQPRGATKVSAGANYPVWAPGGRELFYVSLSDNKVMVVEVDLRSANPVKSSPRELLTLPPGTIGYETPDGQRFLVRMAVEHGRPPVNVIVNWPALLKRATP